MRPRAILTGLMGLLFAPCAVHASIDPKAFADLSFHQHPGAQLPLRAKLNNAAGQQLSLGSALAGKPDVVVLEYLRCKNLCSLVLNGTVRAIVSAGLIPGRDLNLVAISIDPRETFRDAQAAQAMYAKRFPDPAHAASGVHFFTASPSEVHTIASAIGFPYRYDRASDQFAHPAGFVVTTPSGKISRYILGLNPQPQLVKQAVAEASRNEVEPPAHPLLLLCFGYDPDEGTAAALAMRLVRLVSLAMILGLALLIAFLSLRRKLT